MSESDTWPARWEAMLGEWDMTDGPRQRRATRELWALLGEEAMRARAERAALVKTVQRIGARLDELAEEPVREPRGEPRQYERRMGQPTQAPEQLVAVRPDLRGEGGETPGEVLAEIREALEAGQWARAAELAGCGGGNE